MTSSLESRLQEATEEAERLIQAERERLWQALIAEWEERRSQFQREHDAWMTSVQAEKLEIEREKAFYEAAVRNAETDFAATRLAQEVELQAMREEQISAIQLERTELLEKIAAERSEWEQSLAEQRAELQAAREQQASELEAERIKHAEFLAEERNRWQAEHEEWNATRSTQLAEVRGERAVLENRIRFQQEHLGKLRADLDRAQNDHRRERQVERQRLEDDEIGRAHA